MPALPSYPGTVPGRDRFIPRRAAQVATLLGERPWADGSGGPDQFRSLSRLVSALYHYEFHDREQTVTEAWECVSDDPQAASMVTRELSGLLDGANYQPLSTDELEEAIARETVIPLRLEIDLDDYDELLVYRRGSHRDTVEVPRWRGLRHDSRTVTIDEEVVVHARVKRQSWFDERGIDPSDRGLVPGHASLKHFRDVPRADIESLLPSTRVRFRTIDTLLLAVPAVASGIAVIATKLLPTLGLIALLTGAWLGLRDETPEIDQGTLVALLGGVVALGGFMFRQLSKLKSRRIRYLKTLSENLYLRTLGDGTGVLHTLLSSAEDQEVIEVLLAYRFLLDEPGGLTAAELDSRVEAWLSQACRSDIDFDVDDALGKLHRLGVVEGTTRLRARPLDESLAHLDRRWDELFGTDGLQPEPGARTDPDSGPGPLIRLRKVVERFRGRLERRREREG